MTTESLKKTPLHAEHVALGARMMPFAGYDMPVQYSGIIDEHMAVRNAAGLFDVSHMGEFLLEGEGAFEAVQRLVSNDAGKLYDGRAMYTVMCLDDGGIIDDLLVYRLRSDRYLLVVNASNIEKDFAWVQKHVPDNCSLSNISSEMALLALQGPQAMHIAQQWTSQPLSDLKFYHFIQPAPEAVNGLEGVILSHTGYTGESGLEIYCRAGDAAAIWSSLLKLGEPLGLKPAGLGARDTLRLESGYCLYGNDIDETTNPYEAGLGWITKLDKGDFVGKQALEKVKADKPARKLVGFVMQERGIPRHDYPIVNESNETIGIVTSGSQSPILNQGIGLGYVPNDTAYTTPGHKIGIQVRGASRTAIVTRPPFHKA